MPVKDPTSVWEIKEKWLKFILEQHLAQGNEMETSSPSVSVDIKNFATTRNEEGLGFQSDIFTLEINAETTTRDSENSSPVEYKFKVKFLPDEPFLKEFITLFKGPVKEHLFYSNIIYKLNEFQAPLTDNRCKINIPHLIYGGSNNNNPLLVMENLKVSGYKNVDKTEGLDWDHLSVALDQLSKLHAVSHVYNKQFNLLEEYPLLKFNSDMYKFIPLMAEFLSDTFAELLKSKGESDTAKKLKENIETIIKRGTMTDDTHLKTTAPVCLIHGDYWNNNLMFRYKTDEHKRETQVTDCKILDWSNITPGNPMFDIQYLLYTSTKHEVRKNRLDAALKHYHDSFVNYTAQLGSPVENWSYKDFQREWQSMEYVFAVLIPPILVIMLSKEYMKLNNRRPTGLDHPFLLPMKKFLHYIGSKMAKKMATWMYTERGMKFTKSFFPRQWKGIIREILSGENEALSSRIVNYFCEADQKSLLDN